MHADALKTAATYYNLARRRLGLLERGILGPQCYFLAGVYLMYTLNPIQAWSKFQQASQLFHVYLTCHNRPKATYIDLERQTRERHLEQRIYWSCYKAECELRAELDLPSGVLSFGYPDMHPSPPELLVGNVASTQNSPEFIESPASAASRRIQESRAQLEASWFYYLTEITLRRIEIQVLRLFYKNHHLDWTNERIPAMCNTASQFELQLDLW